jgi:hypothetical protein
MHIDDPCLIAEAIPVADTMPRRHDLGGELTIRQMHDGPF